MRVGKVEACCMAFSDGEILDQGTIRVRWQWSPRDSGDEREAPFRDSAVGQPRQFMVTRIERIVAGWMMNC